MLVRFHSDVGGFMMFGDVAVRLIRMTGHSGTVPGAIPADEIAAALARLEAALAALPGDTAAPGPGEPVEPESKERPVTLRQRAFPFLEMLRNASREECGVRWDRS